MFVELRLDALDRPGHAHGADFAVHAHRHGYGHHILDVLAAIDEPAALQRNRQLLQQRSLFRDGLGCDAIKAQPCNKLAALDFGHGRKYRLAAGAAMNRKKLPGLRRVADLVRRLDDVNVDHAVAGAARKQHGLARLPAQHLKHRPRNVGERVVGGNAAHVVEHFSRRVKSTACAHRIQVAAVLQCFHQAKATRYRGTDGAREVGQGQRLTLACEGFEEVQRACGGFHIHERTLRRLKNSVNPCRPKLPPRKHRINAGNKLNTAPRRTSGWKCPSDGALRAIPRGCAARWRQAAKRK